MLKRRIPKHIEESSQKNISELKDFCQALTLSNVIRVLSKLEKNQEISEDEFEELEDIIHNFFQFIYSLEDVIEDLIYEDE